MEKSNANIIIIDDDESLKDDDLIFELEQNYNIVELLSTPKAGVQYIKDNLSSKNIVVLDYRFDETETGRDVLLQIRELSKTTPVILWTANIDKINEINDFINNHTFAIVPKAPYGLLMDKIKEAEVFLDNSIEGALEEWIQMQENKGDDPYLLTISGKNYTLNELLNEIRLNTEFGQKFVKDLNMLTIDLLLRRREKL
jgi:DNA-binding NtrC family response regulator